MPWDINQINNAFLQQALGPGPGAAFDQGRQQAKTERIFDEDRAAKLAAAQRQIALQQQKAADQQALAADPKPQNYAAYYLKYPDDKDAIKSSFETRSTAQQRSDLRDMAAIHGYLSSGATAQAKAQLDARIAADERAGQDSADDKRLRDLIDTDPKQAVGVLAGIIAATADPIKFGDTYGKINESARADAELPGKIALTGAQADEARVKADMAPQVIGSNLATEQAQRTRMAAQTANEIANQSINWARLSLDKDKLATEADLKIRELQQKAGTLDAGTNSVINGAVASAVTNQALASRARELAEKIKATDMSSGWMAAARTAWKGAWGSQDEVSGLRQAFQALTNSQAVRNLPPGPASDKDIQLAKQGFPPPTASKEYIVSFLTGMAKMQDLAAQADDRKASWAAANKGLAPARTDLNINGVMVPAGTTFREFNGVAGKRADNAPPARSYLQKYGGQ